MEGVLCMKILLPLNNSMALVAATDPSIQSSRYRSSGIQSAELNPWQWPPGDISNPEEVIACIPLFWSEFDSLQRTLQSSDTNCRSASGDIVEFCNADEFSTSTCKHWAKTLHWEGLKYCTSMINLTNYLISCNFEKLRLRKANNLWTTEAKRKKCRAKPSIKRCQ